MASILTNTSSMVALQTLKSVNQNLGKVQNQISTGMKVATAKDNAGVWAIASVMRSDVNGMKTISETLNLGFGTVGVARAASEEVVKLLDEAKTKILGAGDLANTETITKLTNDLAKIGAQIDTIVNSASFNGISLVSATATDIDVVSSLVRDDAGDVSTEVIEVEAQDLSGIGAIVSGLTLADIDADLATLEAELTTAIDAAAAFGSAQRQIEIQMSFMQKFQDAISTGIGAIVDADMEEASTRLQALQVQQQLGIQALSIANQAPQSILSLFR